MPVGIQNHADFLKATRDVRIVPKEQLLNEATKRRYTYAQLFKTHGMPQKGGTKLVDRIQAVDAATFAFYNPNEEFSPRQIDTLRSVEVNWAFAKAEYVIIDETAELNAGDDDAYLDYIMSLEQQCVVDTANGMEAALWAKPDVSTMESPSGSAAQAAYSIPCFITRDGLAPSSTNGGVATGTSNWTTRQTLNIANNSWAQNQYETYTAATPDDPDAGLIHSFDRIVEQIKFDKPDGIRSWVGDDSLQNCMIATSLDGQAFYKARLRAINDRMERLSDPKISGPQYEGIPVKRVSELDDHGWTTGQPDYLFVNMEFIVPWFHPGHYMDEKIETGGAKQPNSTTVYKFTWFNLFLRSARRQGRVSAA